MSNYFSTGPYFFDANGKLVTPTHSMSWETMYFNWLQVFSCKSLFAMDRIRKVKQIWTILAFYYCYVLNGVPISLSGMWKNKYLFQCTVFNFVTDMQSEHIDRA